MTKPFRVIIGTTNRAEHSYPAASGVEYSRLDVDNLPYSPGWETIPILANAPQGTEISNQHATNAALKFKHSDGTWRDK